MLQGKKVEISTKEGFDPVPNDKYTAQLVDVNLKTQLMYQSTQEEEVLEYKFQILDDNPMPVGEESTRGRYLWKKFRPSLNSKSHLYKLASAILGRALTKEEVENFDPESLIGKQVDIMVEQSASEKNPENIFNNIIAFSKTIKKLESLPIQSESQEVVQKKSSAVPTTAPDSEAQDFVKNLENEAKSEAEQAELEAAVLEAKLKALRAKAGTK